MWPVTVDPCFVLQENLQGESVTHMVPCETRIHLPPPTPCSPLSTTASPKRNTTLVDSMQISAIARKATTCRDSLTLGLQLYQMESPYFHFVQNPIRRGSALGANAAASERPRHTQRSPHVNKTLLHASRLKTI